MGLAASQGRMLLLTARKSDLEFRAQQISQKRLLLAQELEEISSEYERAVSNRKMGLRVYLNGNDATKAQTSEVDLTYHMLVSNTAGLTGKSDVACLVASKAASTDNYAYKSNSSYRLVDACGNIVVSDVSEIPTAGRKSGSGNGPYLVDTGAVDAEKHAITNSYIVDPSLLKKTSTNANNQNSTGSNYMQDCLRNGKYFVEQLLDNNGTKQWQSLSWDAASDITDSYDKSDDDAAKAKYDRLQAQVQAQDKKLELELDNVETQRNAVQTEMDSVQKVIEDNVEKTFDTFS